MTETELEALAARLARIGGETARGFLGRAAVERKSDDSPVTEADHASQRAVLSELSRRRPHDAVLVEEVVAHPERHRPVADAEYCWIVDPIDGTRNFSRGLGLFTTSIAVARGGRPVAAAVYDGMTGDVVSARSGGGARRDGRPVSVSNATADGDVTIAISSFRRYPVPSAARRWLDRYLFRNVGSLCLHLLWVATGKADAAFAVECKLWDMAAGALLIEEAGGRFTTPNGGPIWPVRLETYRGEDVPFLAGAPAIHAHLLETLRTDPASTRSNGSA